jgi:hypothetical protein
MNIMFSEMAQLLFFSTKHQHISEMKRFQFTKLSNQTPPPEQLV